MLQESAYAAHRVETPEDLVVLALGAKYGMVYGVEPGRYIDKYCAHRDDYNHSWEYELSERCSVIASRYGLRYLKWIEDDDRFEDQDLLVDVDRFTSKRFTTEVAYALSLDWYAPHGWLSPLVRLAACAGD